MTDAWKKPILIVEDFAPIVRIYRHFLKQMGFRDIDAATNGAEAIAMLKTRHYAVIISDWHMEPVTGFKLLQHVRADKVHADVPFILATIESRADYIAAAQAAGVTHYMLKPFRGSALRTVLANASPALAAAMEPPILTKGVPHEAVASIRLGAEGAADSNPESAAAIWREPPLVESLAGPA